MPGIRYSTISEEVSPVPLKIGDLASLDAESIDIEAVDDVGAARLMGIL